MQLGRYVQSPNDDELYEIDYTDWLDTDNAEALLSVSATWDPAYVGPPAFNVAPVYLSNDNLKVLFRVQGGEVGGVYAITLQVTANSGRVVNDCVEITVEGPCYG